MRMMMLKLIVTMLVDMRFCPVPGEIMAMQMMAVVRMRVGVDEHIV
jgi:hypothetical protein